MDLDGAGDSASVVAAGPEAIDDQAGTPTAGGDGVGNCAAQLRLPFGRYGLRQQVGKERVRQLDAKILGRDAQRVEDAAMRSVGRELDLLDLISPDDFDETVIALRVDVHHARAADERVQSE